MARRSSSWRWGHLVVIFGFIALLALMALGVFLVVHRSNHFIAQLLTNIAYIFVICFVSLLLLRVLFFTFFSFYHLFRYRRRFKAFLNHRSRIPGRSGMISVIVPAYNEDKVIGKALESLCHLRYPDLEVIVVDDGSSDNTGEEARKFAAASQKVPVRAFSIPNGGKANALNFGISQARGDYILCVDADSRLDPDALAYAMRHFDDPQVAAVAGNIKVINRLGILPGLQSLEYVIGQNLLRRVMGLWGGVSIIPGPLGVFRKSVLSEIGGYETDTFAEDCDITLRMLAAGWKVVEEMNAIARTEAPESLFPFIRQRYRWTRGTLQSFKKHKRLLLRRGPGRLKVALWLMLFDGILWPLFNLFCHLCIFFLIFQVGLATFLVFWWIHFTLFDMALALMMLASEREQPLQVLYAVIYRLFFVVMMDLCKIMASLEEFTSVGMSWGKLERTGHQTLEPSTT